MIYAALSFYGAVFTQPFSPVIEDTLKESLGFLSFTSEERVTSTKEEQAMTKEEYRNFLRDLEHKIFSEYPIIGATNAKSVVSKANMEKHSYSEYEVEQCAYELADFVSDCIKAYIDSTMS